MMSRPGCEPFRMLILVSARSAPQLQPVDHLVLESDAPFQCRSLADLAAVCHAVAARLNLPPPCLAQLTLNNARRFFRL